MIVLDEKTIRASFVNASRKELSELNLPDLGVLAWDRLDYLGWRDPKFARRAYIVVPSGDDLLGVVLKQAEADPRRRAQCAWCQDITLPNDVVLYAARRAGHGGRNGNTVGTLLCENFECSKNVRMLPPSAYLGYDREAARDARIQGLRQNAASFATTVATEN